MIKVFIYIYIYIVIFLNNQCRKVKTEIIRIDDG